MDAAGGTGVRQVREQPGGRTEGSNRPAAKQAETRRLRAGGDSEWRTRKTLLDLARKASPAERKTVLVEEQCSAWPQE